VLNQKNNREKQYGLKVPVIKGKDSINYGIQLIQEQPFKTSRSSN
jgi:phage terminase large subunit